MLTRRLAFRGSIAGALLLLAACNSSAGPSPIAVPSATVLVAPTLTSGANVPSPSADASRSSDSTAAAAYSRLTAIAAGEAATATAGAAPSATPLAEVAAAVPASALGTYRAIITARDEGYRVYQQPGTLVLSKATPGSGHSAELRLSAGVRPRHELFDLSPGTTVGAIFLATRADLLPSAFGSKAEAAPRVVYDPATRFLTITADPKYGIPGGWSTGPNNKQRKPRPITGGTILLDLGKPGSISGQLDLSSTAATPPVAYSGGMLGTK